MGQKQSPNERETRIGFSPEGIFKRKLTDKTYKGLKCYEIIDGEITGISFVEKPANELKAIIVSEKERLISGVVLIPNKMIYRINPITGEEFYIYFTKESINLLSQKFRLENWSEQERFTLLRLFSEGKSEKNIATSLGRTENEIVDRIILEGEPFRNMVIILMAQNGRSTKEISDRLGFSESELFEIIPKIGGKIITKKDK